MRRRYRLAKKYVARQQRKARRIPKHPFIIPVVTFLLLFFMTSVGLVAINAQTVGASDSRVVHVFIDGQEQTIPTRAPTVGDLLNRLNIKLSNQDIVEPAVDTPIVIDDFQVNIYRAQPVTIIDGSKKIITMSAHQTPREIAAKVGIQLLPEDSVTIAEAGEALKDNVLGRQIVIKHAVPVNINLYGYQIPVRTSAKTVAAALEEKNIKNVEHDTVSPARNTPITANLQIFVVHAGNQIATKEEAIPHTTETISDPGLASGTTVTRQKGSDGKKVVTYEVVIEDGHEVDRHALQEVVAVAPVKQIIAKGTKVFLTGSKAEWLAGSGISSGDYNAVDYIIGHESGWRPNAVSANRCIGLGQSCGGSLAGACPNWQTNPVCQLNFFDNYAKSRYGSWQRAVSFWQYNRWW